MNDKASNQTVLIAMTGGLESTVAAYLLKKQGYRCIGIGLQLFEAGDVTGPFSDVVISDLNKVKDICVYLDIPFYAVNASDIFADTVLDPVVGRILSGHTFEPLVFLNLVLMEILLDKARKFNTNLIATGHYAKVLKNQKTGSFELLVANDLEHDQSYMLARLDQKHLAHLMLPLSEIRKKEVEKIGALIKVDYLKRPKQSIHHIMRDPRMIPLVEARSPHDLLRPGTIYDYRLEASICEHTGIHRFYIGQNNIPSKQENPIDPAKEVISIVPYKGNVFIDFPERLRYTHAHVVRFNAADHLDMSLPLIVYVKMSSGGDKIPCRLYFKNNQNCLIEFETQRTGLLVAGQFFVFYTRPKDKGKVLGSAIVEVGGNFANEEFNTLPYYRKDSDEEEDDEDNHDEEKLHF
ncbi:MAG: aminomethyltransferase beta-barrel domain-containing protein [Bacteriovorax sp.]|jgi:tRNA-specific 2-thiouridylase